MEDLPIIYIDRLRDGHIELIDTQVAPDFLAVADADTSFPEKVEIEGKAYLAEGSLILQLNIATQSLCRCVICNEKSPVDINLEDVYHVEEVSDIKGAVFDTTNLIREMILLEIPAYFECHEGRCPNRDQINSYLKKENSEHDKLKEKDEEYHPFSHLSFENSHVVDKDKE